VSYQHGVVKDLEKIPDALLLSVMLDCQRAYTERIGYVSSPTMYPYPADRNHFDLVCLRDGA
jgi:hypothetical protein